jgi:hypothetical protein
MNLDKLLGNLTSNMDLFDRLEGVISSWYRADWKGARKKKGAVAGPVAESINVVSGYASPMIRVAHYNANTSWSGIRIERLLARHGIVLFDRGIQGDDLYFRVKRRQLNWAEYVLLRAGVPVSIVRDPRNVAWVSRFPVGDEPARHSKWRR